MEIIELVGVLLEVLYRVDMFKGWRMFPIKNIPKVIFRAEWTDKINISRNNRRLTLLFGGFSFLETMIQ